MDIQAQSQKKAFLTCMFDYGNEEYRPRTVP